MVPATSTSWSSQLLAPHNAPLVCGSLSYSHRCSRRETTLVAANLRNSPTTNRGRRLSSKSPQSKAGRLTRSKSAAPNTASLSGRRRGSVHADSRQNHWVSNSDAGARSPFNGAATNARVNQGATTKSTRSSDTDGGSMSGRDTSVKAAASDAAGGSAAGSQVFAVTGATGFLGSHLLQQLLAAGHTVRCLCRQPNALPPHPNIQVVLGPLEDPSALDSLLQGSSGLFHLAGIVTHSRAATSSPQPNSSPQPTIAQTTIDGTLAILHAASKAGVNRVVYASTSGTVGASRDPGQVASDDSPYAMGVVGGWPYYRAKIEAEERARAYAEGLGMELMCMRPTLILGPGDYRLSSCRTVLDIMERRIPFVPPGGLSFVDVRDVATAFIAAMQSAPPSSTYLLGAVNMTLSDYFQLIARYADVAPPWLSVPPRVAWVLAAAASKLLPLIGRKDPSLDPVVVEMAQIFWYIDWSRAEKELGFSPRPYEETVADTVVWLREHRRELSG